MCWLPYFVKYYPGLIYGDSTISLLQIFGKIPYNNHHPVAYTLFIKICMAIGSFVGDNTVGVAIYTIFQMIFMSIIFSYSICWLRNKGISKIVCLVVVGFYALPGFWAQHAISMWKDPLFSALVFFFSLMLFDIIYSNGKVINEKRFRIRCVLCVLGISFLRNNGIYVVAFSIALLICCSFVKKGKWMINKSFLFLMITSIILVYIVQGPIYAIMKIETDPVEAYGIPLQQVARTVVYEGDMSKDEKKFINDIMPLEKYVENYSPGLVDHLKWSNEFNTEFFNKHQDKFVKVWLSLMIKNPKIYLEAWALNTCGFWGINYWELNGFKKNITMGVPRGEELKEAYQINVSNSKSDESQGVFSLSTPMPAVALCLWIALGMIVFALVNRVPRYLILFIPCLGNILTLVLASPITYWPRYGLSFICLLPLCIVFPFIIKPLKQYENKKNIKQK